MSEERKFTKRQKVDILDKSTAIVQEIIAASETIHHTILGKSKSDLSGADITLITSECESLKKLAMDIDFIVTEAAAAFLSDEAMKTVKKVKKAKQKTIEENAAPALDDDDVELMLEFASKTELLQIARQKGISILPSLPRERIIELLFRKDNPSSMEQNPIDLIREAMTDFIRQFFDQVAGQLDCDMNCWMCPNLKVVECYVDNKSNVKLDLDVGTV